MTSERNYRQIFNSSSDAILVIDGNDHTLLDVNDTALALFGYEKEELLGRNLSLMDAHSMTVGPAPVKGTLASALDQGFRIVEWKALKKNQESFWAEVSINRSEIGSEQRILAVVRDVTEHRKARELMIQTDFDAMHPRFVRSIEI
ncbi:MAG: PAS domain S-box protein [Pseudomonadota bacterium]